MQEGQKGGTGWTGSGYGNNAWMGPGVRRRAGETACSDPVFSDDLHTYILVTAAHPQHQDDMQWKKFDRPNQVEVTIKMTIMSVNTNVPSWFTHPVHKSPRQVPNSSFEVLIMLCIRGRRYIQVRLLHKKTIRDLHRLPYLRNCSQDRDLNDCSKTCWH